MKLATFVASAAVATSLATAAFGQQLLASDPQTFMDFYFDNGYPAQLTEDAVGDPLIEFRHNGETMAMFFYDCVENTDCLAIQFYSGYQLEESLPLERLNEWNSGERRFTRAYLTEDNAARLEMDVATSLDGVSARDFGDLLELWLDRVVEFEEFIGW
jgi:hypothetical protein